MASGIRNAEDYEAWPIFSVSSIFDAGDGLDTSRRSTFEQNLQRGLMCTSDYTGLWGDREALTQVLQGYDRKFGGNSASSVRFVRACDWNGCAQDVVKYWHEVVDENSCCLFDSILDRLPPIARSWVDSATPDEPCSSASAADAHADILLWLQEHKSMAFPFNATSKCLTHGGRCFVNPLLAMAKRSKEKQQREAKRLRRSDSSSSAQASTSAPLVMNNAGTTCTGWTPAGKTLRFADPSEVPHAVYQVERGAAAESGWENLFVQGNSEKHDYITKLAKPLKHTRTVIRIKWTPTKGGYPLRRPRSYTAGISQSTMVWLGPVDEEDIQLHFEHFFKKDLLCDASIFLKGSPDDLLQEIGTSRSTSALTQPRLVCKGLLRIPEETLTY